jgi:transcriptional regulator with XRE-family HTH domain
MDIKASLTIEGMTQRELARRTGYREETISRLLHDRYKPSEKMRSRIATVLGQPIKELFSKEPKA